MLGILEFCREHPTPATILANHICLFGASHPIDIEETLDQSAHSNYSLVTLHHCTRLYHELWIAQKLEVTFRRTITCNFDEPRLDAVSARSFIDFKRRRELYWKQIRKKSKAFNSITVPVCTTFPSMMQTYEYFLRKTG